MESRRVPLVEVWKAGYLGLMLVGLRSLYPLFQCGTGGLGFSSLGAGCISALIGSSQTENVTHEAEVPGMWVYTSSHSDGYDSWFTSSNGGFECYFRSICVHILCMFFACSLHVPCVEYL